MIEAEQLIRPLEEIFNQESVQNLRNQGAVGVITLELSVGDLVFATKVRGISMYDLGFFEHEPNVNHCLVLSPDESTVPRVTLFVKDDVAYVLAEEFGAFKELMGLA